MKNYVSSLFFKWQHRTDHYSPFERFVSTCSDGFPRILDLTQTRISPSPGLELLTWRHTSDSFDIVPGSSGRLNFFCEPMAAGKGGAENMAATVLIRVIQDCICSAFLRRVTHAHAHTQQTHMKAITNRS